ncbi:uncharacterized protein BJ212DRAFT_251200 [Suillus subaureus]|uniref:Uncharacterized protein n=1 Tax=Suillus subaureus TaxID=48587 RepID=A0A9P7E984_9AGAM|nr:uncharacterized protein BJ212DRAFT_251200 [Suillus subaureus]KAG1815025.1 hypothetical protein BJ212DRAFT_251200 [Suillus subaureus]
MFLSKVLCRVARVLGEPCCPPHSVAYVPSDYLNAVYYPRYHLSSFASPKNPCSWLSRALVEHGWISNSCHARFAGCVPFDSDLVVATHRSSGFLCSVGWLLVILLMCTRVLLPLDRSPHRFRHSPIVLGNKLSNLSAPYLARCADSLPGGGVRRTKAANVRIKLQHFLDLRALPLPLIQPRRLAQFADVGRHLLPLWYAYLAHVYGDEVAAALRLPPRLTYVSLLCSDNTISWSTFDLAALTRTKGGGRSQHRGVADIH